MNHEDYLARVTAVGFVTASKEAFADIFPRLTVLEGNPSDPALESRVMSLEADEPVEDAALAHLAAEDTVLHVQIDGVVDVANQAQSEVDAAEAVNSSQSVALSALQAGLTAAENKITALQNLVAAIPPPVDVLAVLANAATVTVSKSGGKIGFFGKAPVVKQAALTAATATQVTETKIGVVTVLSSGSKTVIDNHTTRINEIEARLKGYGLL